MVIAQGVAINLTVEGATVVSVKHHKTGYTGPAKICIGKPLLYKLNGYL
jgi:hypothetical protein